ncbi:MAG: hypothetical protein IJS68_02620 [Clostridia bacterium]|nr:hypothetical protein [Clostridia bacterium]
MGILDRVIYEGSRDHNSKDQNENSEPKQPNENGQLSEHDVQEVEDKPKLKYNLEKARTPAVVAMILAIIASVAICIISLVIVGTMALSMFGAGDGLNALFGTEINIITFGISGIFGLLAMMLMLVVVVIIAVPCIFLCVFQIVEKTHIGSTKNYSPYLYGLNIKSVVLAIIGFFVSGLLAFIGLVVTSNNGHIAVYSTLYILALLNIIISILILVDRGSCRAKFRTLSQEEQNEYMAEAKSLRNIYKEKRRARQAGRRRLF